MQSRSSGTRELLDPTRPGAWRICFAFRPRCELGLMCWRLRCVFERCESRDLDTLLNPSSAGRHHNEWGAKWRSGSLRTQILEGPTKDRRIQTLGRLCGLDPFGFAVSDPFDFRSGSWLYSCNGAGLRRGSFCRTNYATDSIHIT